MVEGAGSKAGLPPLIIGVGQPWRGDDAAGLDALALLDGGGPWDCRPHHGEGLGLIALWEDRPLVLVIDAALSGAAPGALHRLEVADGAALDGAGFRCSSHAFGVREAIETGRALGKLPDRLIIHAVEGARWGLGEPLSDAVAAALPALADAVRRDLYRLADAF
ncbi:Hydrogenase maturation protease [Caenispirillum salinarum AK4]|uniref:Hydrogenase maturation protease n=1 Tax=Caenispirillum salinarum AK4 TaxID=1238182 RepID=K9H155_9PROT|nr:hydrogenase maturation protease [Caenispirillum salinarum]EKV30779.1 Hydrogenase maturation protease [Caenispirillum salinarum AK4]